MAHPSLCRWNTYRFSARAHLGSLNEHFDHFPHCGVWSHGSRRTRGPHTGQVLLMFQPLFEGAFLQANHFDRAVKMLAPVPDPVPFSGNLGIVEALKSAHEVTCSQMRRIRWDFTPWPIHRLSPDFCSMRHHFLLLRSAIRRRFGVSRHSKLPCPSLLIPCGILYSKRLSPRWWTSAPLGGPRTEDRGSIIVSFGGQWNLSLTPGRNRRQSRDHGSPEKKFGFGKAAKGQAAKRKSLFLKSGACANASLTRARVGLAPAFAQNGQIGPSRRLLRTKKARSRD